jgi:hypothetical protein
MEEARIRINLVQAEADLKTSRLAESLQAAEAKLVSIEADHSLTVSSLHNEVGFITLCAPYGPRARLDSSRPR